MCDVHMVDEVNELRTASETLLCCECGWGILAGENYRHVEGHLDDGTPGRLIYVAHDDCHLEAVDDVNDDGCFTWGGVEAMKDREDDMLNTNDGKRVAYVAVIDEKGDHRPLGHGWECAKCGALIQVG